MKLDKVTSNDKVQRTTISLHTSTVDLIESFKRYYKSIYNEDIQLSLLLEEVFKEFVSKDKGFKKFMESEKDTAPKSE